MNYTIGSFKVEIYFWIVLITIISYISGSFLVISKFKPELIDKAINIPFFVVFLIGLLSTYRLWWVISVKLKLFSLRDNQIKNSSIKLGETYIHYKNKEEYIPIDFCKEQINNEWVESIIYLNNNEDKFVRSVEEFIEKFKIKG